jgi:pyruvate dehydrogenase E1 component beta subunit
MAEEYFSRAIRDGLAAAMIEDPSVIVMGEDVVQSTIGATRGLAERFGRERVRNTPISEATFVGMAAGAAMRGLRPVVDLGFSSFLYVAMDQVANQIARLRYMSGGQLSLPLVLLAGSGPAGSAAAQHSENPHPIMMHLGGLKVVYPSAPADARGLILASIRDDSPVVYLFDFVLAGTKGPISNDDWELPLGRARVCTEGRDVTVVALGAAVRLSMSVASELCAEGIGVEVIDPRTLVPLDWECIRESVARTGRVVVVDPARRTCGAGGEIVARVSEELWHELRAAPRRVTWADVPMPFAPGLEAEVTLSSARLKDVITATCQGRTGQGAE